jgi:hypothetical protein
MTANEALVASDRAYDAADRALRQWRRSVHEALTAFRTSDPSNTALIESLERDYEAALAANKALKSVGASL